MKSSTDFTEDEYEVQFETSVKAITNYLDALDAIESMEEGIIASKDEAVFSKLRDAANVALTVSKIESFPSFNHTVDGVTEIAIEFANVSDFFTGVSTKSSAVLTYPVQKDSMGGDYLHIDIVDEDVQFYCPLLDTSSVNQTADMDPIQCSTQIKISGSDLSDTIKHCKKVETEKNKSVEFRTHGDVMTVSSEDPTRGSVDKQFHATGPDSETDLGEKSVTVSLEYLKDIEKIISKADQVTIHIDDDYPIRIDIPIDDSGSAKVIYIISPRIKSEE